MFQSMVHLLQNSIENFPDKNALLYKKNGEYAGITYRELGERIEKLAHGLAARGLKPGERIAILSNNRPEWPICDFAIFSIRGIVVPVYHTLPEGQIADILKHAGVRAIFVEDQTQFDKVQRIFDHCQTLEFIFPITPIGKTATTITSFQQLLTEGQTRQREHPGFFQESVDAINPKETCSMVYTSGTTGEPKGVMLHHRGFVLDVVNSESVFGLNPDDVFLSFLPLSHLYERLGGHWCPLYKGCTIGYADSINTVVDDIRKLRPTVMVSVPRLYEKISNTVIDQVESGPTFKQKIFYRALKIGRRYHNKRLKNQLDVLRSLQYQLAEKLVFNKIKQKLGGRFRFPISGGAPLSTETLKFFEAMGLHIVEGYGMTETHLIITLTPPGNTRYGSCGTPIPGVEVKIADDGEILVRGDTVMSGYYRQPELTKKVIDQDRWFHTGDMGYMDDDRYLFITDRKRNILVTAGGKNVAPAPLEHALKQSRFIDDVCLIGDKRKFISAIIMPNYENLTKWAHANNLPARDKGELVNNPQLHQMMNDEINRLQAEFARFEKVKKFILLEQPLTVESGELTPSLKIKRSVVQERFKNQIDHLYSEL